MKILMVTIPLRNKSEHKFPLYGLLSVMKYIRKHSNDDVYIELYNIDAHRPDFKNVIEYIRDFSPDILGISAVVSTAYSYTKRLTREVKRVMPDVRVVVGGNLCASAEILLHKAGVDLCVLGEGEKVFLNVVNHYKDKRPHSDLSQIPGLAYLDERGVFINTGFESPLAADEIWDVDWADIERDGSVDSYFPIVTKEMLEREGVTINPDDHRFDDLIGKKRLGILSCAKGCVNRCTFCHRWNKGMRSIPIDDVFKRLDDMIRRFNVGVIWTVAESFGEDRRWLNEFIKRIESYNLLWLTGAVRVNTLDSEVIDRMRRSGCYGVHFGNESGSAKILEVMEKKVSIEDNYKAALLIADSGFINTFQLVIGMPGESPETIRETIEYCKFGTCLSPKHDPRALSINYAQALPGTPLYEFARSCNLIGSDIDSEEKYLISISDKNASDPFTNINFTNFPRLTMLSWQLLIQIEVNYNYFRKFGESHYNKMMLGINGGRQFPEVVRNIIQSEGAAKLQLFFKLVAGGHALAIFSFYPVLFYRLRRFLNLITLLRITRKSGITAGWILCLDYVRYLFGVNKKPWQFTYRSLRKIVNEEQPPIPGDTIGMVPLRKGR
jgi:anaerobic magnesium-protoporphyrin IX monomethyl ester cyclase